MITEKDNQQLENKGISSDKVLNQLANFVKGFPYARLQKAALINDGIQSLSLNDFNNYIKSYEEALDNGLDVAKFVPASGAATRMFKALFEYIQADKNQQLDMLTKAPYYEFANRLADFAFYKELIKGFSGSFNKSNPDHIHTLVSLLLLDDGLNYGKLPKGLLQFHAEGVTSVTPLEEHLRETAKYANNNGQIGKVHFTVSPEHHARFQSLLEKVLPIYKEKYGIEFNIGFSFQKAATDTIAVKPDNTPFRTEDGHLLFRPGGHGALIENLNDLQNELIFIKNIDNVVPEHLQEDTVNYKKALAGLLLNKKSAVFSILERINGSEVSQIEDGIQEGMGFLTNAMQLTIPVDIQGSDKEVQIAYLNERLNRPIRVCGMVKNEGEPGGGPFWVKQSDGSSSLQIVEGAQIDPNNVKQQDILKSSSHFNPVDLVCYIKDYKGDKFDLHQFIDPSTGFISEKTLNGKPLKALELPGLWNGAMANWLTFFVEVPISTFNPVKTVMDLLRPQHQPKQ